MLVGCAHAQPLSAYPASPWWPPPQATFDGEMAETDQAPNHKALLHLRSRADCTFPDGKKVSWLEEGLATNVRRLLAFSDKGRLHYVQQIECSCIVVCPCGGSDCSSSEYGDKPACEPPGWQ
jgi:hypothetical protein